LFLDVHFESTDARIVKALKVGVDEFCNAILVKQEKKWAPSRVLADVTCGHGPERAESRGNAYGKNREEQQPFPERERTPRFPPSRLYALF